MTFFPPSLPPEELLQTALVAGLCCCHRQSSRWGWGQRCDPPLHQGLGQGFGAFCSLQHPAMPGETPSPRTSWNPLGVSGDPVPNPVPQTAPGQLLPLPAPWEGLGIQREDAAALEQ